MDGWIDRWVDGERVKQKSKHVLVLKLLFQIFAHRRALSRLALSARFLGHIYKERKTK